jgi:hypothetical protein
MGVVLGEWLRGRERDFFFNLGFNKVVSVSLYDFVLAFFTCLLPYDSYTGEFLYIFPYVHVLYPSLVHPLYYSPSFSIPLLKITSTCLNVPYSYRY